MAAPRFLFGDSSAATIPSSEAQWRALVVVVAGDAIGKRVSSGRSTSHVYPWHMQIAGTTASRLKSLGLVRTRYESVHIVLMLPWIVPTDKLRVALERAPALVAERLRRTRIGGA